MTARPPLRPEQFDRYRRHLSLPELGVEGQQALLAGSVLLIGAGGLGCPLAQYLAAAGVGRIGLVDFDVVDASNLQRQVIHTTERLGAPKVESAKAALAAVNPDITVETFGERLTAKNAAEIIGNFDLVADGSDNFDTRYLVNDACYLAKVPLVSAALLRFEGQLSTFRAYEGEGDAKGPCYRCVFREPPPEGMVPRCEEAGIFGAVAGAVGSLQAAEVLKEILGLGDTMSGRLLLYDALGTTFRVIKVKRAADCPLCGDAPTIRDLSIHS